MSFNAVANVLIIVIWTTHLISLLLGNRPSKSTIVCAYLMAIMYGVFGLLK